MYYNFGAFFDQIRAHLQVQGYVKQFFYDLRSDLALDFKEVLKQQKSRFAH